MTNNPISNGPLFNVRGPAKRDLWLSTAFFNPKAVATKGDINLRQWLVNNLIDWGFLNADPCCDDYVEGEFGFDVTFTGASLLPNGTVSLPSMAFTNDPDSGIYRIAANNIGVAVNAAKVLDIGVAGLAITGILSTTTTGDIGTSLNVGTSLTFNKEVNHTVSVTTSTTAATAGGNLSIVAGTGATSGAGGSLSVTAGDAGATAGTAAGNLNLGAGTGTSTTVSPIVVLTNNEVVKPINTASVASGGTITGKQLVDGYIAITGATGNVALPTASQITTALGTSPTGTSFLFTVNASAMTATNVVTLTVGANTTALKQVSAGDTATSQLLTVTQTSGTHIAVFRIVFDTATSCVIGRVI